MHMDIRKLKKKLKELKELEKRLRSSDGVIFPDNKLIWPKFFSFREGDEVEYPFSLLSALERESRKKIFGEFLYSVYIAKFKEQGLLMEELKDPFVLQYFGLPLHASTEDIKRKFRELAKQYHPDKGGGHEEMIELLNMYENVTANKK